MQNTKCQLLWNDANFFHGVGERFLAFFLPLEAKIQNGKWIPFYQKFCMVFSSIL
jgi:hypothetical protein